MKIKYVFLIPIFILFLGETLHGQDWANLTRYRTENSALGALKPHDTRVVFMGNSITDLWIKAYPDFFAEHGYLDRGISGQTTPQMLLRFRADVIDLHPKVVVILAGTNDIAGNTGPSTLGMIEDNIASMCELAKIHHIKVVLSSLLPVYDYPWHKGLHPDKKIIALNQWIKQYATSNKFVYLDYFSALVDHKDGFKSQYTIDGVHPNKAGYKIMMPLAEKAILKALSQR
ncbi:SGNH/GDSL hydrolase family protein [Microbacter margulisiae]|uniref:Lysophospholipase L1-like esterase n=1 Tax=Microbacter margulisiae TaxID=1350067 RepID=A0A7W5H3S8_9PORP|nr:SGNH/GDSL hydrolase family protein [Microbacter margulisiae]MBB3188657.1 lysophospholipase L1-like esterase [Microbacter margulisiae]